LGTNRQLKLLIACFFFAHPNKNKAKAAERYLLIFRTYCINFNTLCTKEEKSQTKKKSSKIEIKKEKENVEHKNWNYKRI
jgi:hypothetical protein